MRVLSKLYYHTWNIGFIEQSIESVVTSKGSTFPVHWVKHNYKNRFFADPFLLSADDKYLRVLVEDFPYYHKKGMISLLTIDRKTYNLLERKVILGQPFHMSYPFIMRDNCGNVKWVAPEASMSGKLYRYTINPNTHLLENKEVLVPEPLLDSTIVGYNGRYWLFCTRRGTDSNKKLYIYHSLHPEGPWAEHDKNPTVNDASMARPAGYVINVDGDLYRVIQKCDKHYGETINISKIDILTENEFKEHFVKTIKAQHDEYSYSFHTINGLDNICVVDGVRIDFQPFRRLWYELRNFLHI